MMKEVKEAFRFVCSSDLWTMCLWSIALITSYLQLLKARIFGSKATPNSVSIDSHSGSSRPICVITGASSGLGKATAFALAEKGFFVILVKHIYDALLSKLIIHQSSFRSQRVASKLVLWLPNGMKSFLIFSVGRSSHLLSKTLKEIKRKNKDAQLKSFKADMISFQSILNFKISLEQWLSDAELHPSIQLLVNNAGIMATTSRPTIEGYDKMMATNYIGPFCLTKLLLPLLKHSSVPSRIVNVTSFTHHYASLQKFDKDSVTGVYLSTLNRYPYPKAYEYSKLCLLLFSYELHRQLRFTDDSHHVSVIAADPGFAKTNIMHEYPSYVTAIAFLGFNILGLLQSPDKGAESIVDAALAPAETSGAYYFGGKGRTIESSQVSRDHTLAKQLWETSCELFSELNLPHNNNNNN